MGAPARIRRARGRCARHAVVTSKRPTAAGELVTVDRRVQAWARAEGRDVVLTVNYAVGPYGVAAAVARACLLVVDDVSSFDRWRYDPSRGPLRRAPRIEVLLAQRSGEATVHVAARTGAVHDRSGATQRAARDRLAALQQAIEQE